MLRPLWPSTRILGGKKENISLNTLINALLKSLWQGLKQKIPFTPSTLAERSQGKEVQTHPPGSHEARSGSHGI